MSAGRLEQEALSSLLSVDDHASSHDDDVLSPRVANSAASAIHNKLRPWAARAVEATATAKIRASNLTQVKGATIHRGSGAHVTPLSQMNKQPEIALVELAMAGPGKRGKQGDKKPRTVSRSTDIVPVRETPPLPPRRVAVSAESAVTRAAEDSDDSQLESSDQESDRRANRGMLLPLGLDQAHATRIEPVARGGIAAEKLHRVRQDASASSSPGRVSDKLPFGVAAGGITLPAMIKTVTRSSLHGGGGDER
jgi:hypothetical protein